MLAACKCIQGVSTREAEELCELEDSVGGGTNSFSLAWEAYLEALQLHPTGGRLGECEFGHITSLLRCLTVI